MKLHHHVYFREEPKIMGGKTFVFDLQTFRVLVCPLEAYEVLKELQKGCECLSDLCVTTNKSKEVLQKFITGLADAKLIELAL